MSEQSAEVDNLGHLRALIEQTGDLDDRYACGRTRLRRAVGWPDIAMVRMLVEMGVDTRAMDENGRQPLHHAALWSLAGATPGSFDSRPDIMRTLLGHGADIEAKDSQGDTPLSLASDNGRSSSVQFLLRANADPSTCGLRGCPTPQYIIDFLQTQNEEEAVASLLTSRPDINAPDQYAHTLLDRAAWLGSPAAVMALLHAGANPNSCGRHKNRPLHFSAELIERPGGHGAISALIRAGANLNETNEFGNTPLLMAAFHGSAPAVVLLLQAGANPHICGGLNGYNPLHYAFALMAHPDGAAAVTALLENGVEANHRGHDGTTPLFRAAFHGSISAVRILRQAGGVSLARNRFQSEGDPVQFVAEMMRSRDGFEVLTPLLHAGMDANGKNKAGISLLDFALSIRSRGLVKVLLDERAVVRQYFHFESIPQLIISISFGNASPREP